MHIKDFAHKRAHCIGIGGSSMSGLAKLLQKEGYIVTGSDRDASHKTEELQSAGIPVSIGHKAENVHGADVILYSAAIARDNPERAEAARLSIPQIERSVLLGQIMEGYPASVGISGTHGKTTTTAMLSQMLIECGIDPSVHIGGELDAIGGSTRLGASDLFVCEACEFARSFLQLRPTVAVILNINADHLDCYGDIEHIEQAFFEYTQNVPQDGWVLGCGDDARVRGILDKCGRKTRTFGMSPYNDLRPDPVSFDEEGKAHFTATLYGHPLCEVELRVPGKHNLIDALAALACASVLEVPMQAAAESLSRFTGAHRRVEKTGTIDGAELFTDYGHTPEEIQSALSVAKLRAKGRVIAVWQPHTYSRTKTLYEGFLGCFEDADAVLIADIMGAREKDPGDIKSEMFVNDLTKRGKEVYLTPTFDDAEQFLRGYWKEGDLMISHGCGNIHLLNEQIHRHGDTKQ